MEYIQRIRATVGHDQVLIPANAVVILNAQGEVLLQLRDDTSTWGLPGGLMDVGETVVESICREAFEETGVWIKNPRLFGVFSGPKFEVTYPNGDLSVPVILGFYTTEFEGSPKETKESLKIGFFPLTAIPPNMNPSHRGFVDGFLEFRKRGAVFPVLN